LADGYASKNQFGDAGFVCVGKTGGEMNCEAYSSAGETKPVGFFVKC
jgi:hypothetical protein